MIVDDESKVMIGRGTLGGAFAWIAGYLFTYVTAIGDVTSDEKFEALELAANESLSVEMIGMLFYNAHRVTIDVPQYSILQALDPNHNFISAQGGSTTLLYGVPIVTLLFAGALVTIYTRHDLESTTDAALTGTTVMVGYLPLAVLGTTVFAIDLGDGAMQPDLLLTIGFAGTFYPLIFGAIGGIAASIVTRASHEGSVFDPDST
ncbi:hypothetical protein [Natrinema halophilum]|uniref:DUF7978 domain-containing protein n=1 Tax=Natrinema halophilum TaxID=1699371 RepID=A0A7D5GLC7_9EURY|nr:hypothetical protein [Natrinema halophilum]QLG49372.1 hypothetical protein HYG82_11115 [Natrinema halophilum]